MTVDLDTASRVSATIEAFTFPFWMIGSTSNQFTGFQSRLSIDTSHTVALKAIDKEKALNVGMMEQIKREIVVMRLGRHPNVVQLHEVMASKTRILLAIQYVKDGDLLMKVAGGKLKEEVARRYIQQFIRSVDFCHSCGVCHTVPLKVIRDLKELDLKGTLAPELGKLRNLQTL